MTFLRENLLWIVIITLVMFGFINLLIDAYYAWRVPDELKRRYLSRAEKWPQWFPFRGYYLQFYASDNFIYLMRIGTVIIPTGWILFILAILADRF